MDKFWFIPKSILFKYLSLFDLIYFSRTSKQNKNDIKKYANPGLVEIYFVEFGHLLENIFDKIEMKLCGLKSYSIFRNKVYPNLNYHEINKLKKLKIFDPKNDDCEEEGINIGLNNNISEIFLNTHFRDHHIQNLFKTKKISLVGPKISPDILRKFELTEIHFNDADGNYCNEIIKNATNLETLYLKNCSFKSSIFLQINKY